MSVSALSSSSSSYWEKMLAQMKSSSGTQAQDDLAGKLFGELDSDGDGALSLAETGLSSNLYNSIDTDGDGSVSQTELQKAIETQRNAMLTNMQLGQGQTTGTASTDASSTDSSSTLSAAQGLLSSIMNGQMPGGAQGSQSGRKHAGLASKLFSALDSDGNGGLSMDETGLSQSVFDAMDTDQDGSVSSDELAAALKKQRENMQSTAQASQGDSSSQSSSGEPDAKTLLSSIMNGQMPPPPPQGQATSSSQNGSAGVASKLFSDLDSDGNEGLSISETGLKQSAFDSMDTNQDGSVSSDELAAALEKQREAMGSGQGSTSRTDMARSFLSALANSTYQTISQTTASTQSVEAVA